jgi:cytochrome c biogenesis protein CcdA
VSWRLLLGIAGLAVLDSFNPATLVAVTLILLGSRDHPVLETVGFVLGAFLSVFALGVTLFLGADAAAAALEDGLAWLRRLAFGLAAGVLLVSAVRALRPRTRRAIGLPAWFNPVTAVGLGAVMTAADLPNAFPYLIAIERLVNASVPTLAGVLVLAGYAVIYCLPCLALLAMGLAHGERVRGRLRSLHDRFGSQATIPASRPRAALLLAASVVLGAVAATA